MRGRPYGSLVAISLVAFGLSRTAMSEVYVEVDSTGRFSGTHVAPARTGKTVKVWEPVGAAAYTSLILNPDGDLRGDGRPDVAVNPTTGFPRAVWAARHGNQVDIVISDFDGQEWTQPVRITAASGAGEADPKLAYTANGTAVVVWWVKGTSPSVRMTYQAPGSGWTQAVVVSPSDQKAWEPAIAQDGALTIIAYRTKEGIKIVTYTIVTANFGDGPTPFPRQDTPPGVPSHPITLPPL